MLSKKRGRSSRHVLDAVERERGTDWISRVCVSRKCGQSSALDVVVGDYWPNVIWMRQIGVVSLIALAANPCSLPSIQGGVERFQASSPSSPFTRPGASSVVTSSLVVSCQRITFRAESRHHAPADSIAPSGRTVSIFRPYLARHRIASRLEGQGSCAIKKYGYRSCRTRCLSGTSRER